MPAQLENPTSTDGNPSGNDGNFDIGSFMSDAAASPKVENPAYEDNTAADGNGAVQGTEPTNDGDAVEEGATPAVGTDPQGASGTPKRTLAEIQQHRSAQAKARKFDGLAEDEVPYFKQMSQQAYDFLYPKYLATKEHEAKIKELSEQAQIADQRRWYEEPDAYTLHPEFRQINQHTQDLSTEEDFWKQQLEKLEAGETCNQLVFETDKNGNRVYKYGPEIEASPAAKADIIQKLAALTQFKIAANGKLDSLKQSFVGKHKSFGESLDRVNNTLFGKLDFTDKSPLGQRYQAFLNDFPAEFRTQTPYKMLAQAGAVIEGLVQRIRTAEASKSAKAGVAKVVKLAGPGSGVAASSGNGESSEKYDNFFKTATRRSF